MSYTQKIHNANMFAKDYYGSLGATYLILLANQISKFNDIIKNQQASALTKVSNSALTMLNFPWAISSTLTALYEKDPLERLSNGLSAVRSGLGASVFIINNYFKGVSKAVPAMEFVAEIADTSGEGVEFYQAFQERREAQEKLKSSTITKTEITVHNQKRISSTIAIVSKAIAVFVGLASIFAIVFNVAVVPAAITCILTIASLSLGVVRHFYNGINQQESLAKLQQQKVETIP